MLGEDDETRTGEVRRRANERTPGGAGGGLGDRPRVLAGRYVLVSQLGAGGMGVVYEAHDRQLDREVAIKLLHPRAATTHARRLLREAQTLAKLSHPNLVPVFDVGWAGDELFVAMELVRGHSLAHRAPAAWRETLRLLIEAGRGLDHAHQCGLVHRDFKPANVLVGADGRARVADFGLARPVRSTSSSNASGDSSEDPEQALITRPGSNPGTPAYMPPELARGGPFDERSDQFSFCVSAWEVLYGARPDRDPRTGAVICVAPSPSKVPRVVRLALLRGMSSQPAERHPSLRELLRTLDPDRRRLRSPAIAVGAAALLVGGLAYAGLGEAAPCEAVEREIQLVYDEDVRARIRGKAEAELPQLTDLHDAIDSRLQDYAAQWSELRRDTCIGHRLEHRHSDLVFERRMRCLEERRDALHGVVTVLADSTARETLLAGPAAIAALPAIAACADDETLLAMTWQPKSPDEAALAQRLHAELGRVRALVNTGQLEAALPEADALVRESEVLPSSPVRAKAQLVWASLRREYEDAEGAFAGFKDAAETAAAARDDETLAQAWLDFVAVLANDHTRAQEFETVAALVEGLIERLSAPAPSRARLLDSRAHMARSAGDPEQAVSHAVAAVELLESAAVDEPLLLAQLQTTAGLALRDAGRYDEAASRFEAAVASSSRVLTANHPRIGGDLINLALVQPPEASEASLNRSVEILRAAFPGGHPELGLALANLGLVLLNRGAHEQAEAALREALEHQRRVFRTPHMHTAFTLITLADALNEAGRRDEALALADESLAIRRELLPDDHSEIGRALRLVGSIHFDDGNVPQAQQYYEDALAVFERGLPADHPLVAGALNGIGECAVLQHDGARALEVCTRALEIERRARGDDAIEVGSHLSCIASAHQELGHPERAIPLLERTLEIWTAIDMGPLFPAQIRLQLATALDQAGRDRDRVVALATAVLEVASAHPESRGRLLEPAQRLLDEG